MYLKNRLPHRAIKCTPYFAWTRKKPSTKLLRIFGCPVIVKNPGKKPAKLNHNTSSGIFLGYTATDHNIYYRDSNTKRIKIATHVQFDEAGFTLPRFEISSTIIALQELGMPKEDAAIVVSPSTTAQTDTTAADTATVKLLSPHGKLLSRSGLSTKHGINVTAGMIDPDFRGNVLVNLYNTSTKCFIVNQGDRIAQLVFYYIAQPTLQSAIYAIPF